MRVFHRWEEMAPEARGGSLIIGNFDGLHLGHVSLLNSAVAQAKQAHRPVSLLTFFPHPVEVLFPERRQLRITTTSEKLALLDELGLDNVLVAPFNKELAENSAEDFFENYVWKTFSPKSLHVGSDFRFGKGREGNEDWLRQKAQSRGFELCPSPLVLQDGVRISSTEIRKQIADGNVEAARRLLGRPYGVSGQVEHGDHRGRQLGFPTANVSYPDDKILPKNGVYVTEVFWQKQTFPSVTNVGVRPTVANVTPRPRIETHLFDFNQRLYDEFLTVRFLSRVRDEQRFGSLEELTSQIARDSESARGWFKSAGGWNKKDKKS